MDNVVVEAVGLDLIQVVVVLESQSIIGNEYRQVGLLEKKDCLGQS